MKTEIISKKIEITEAMQEAIDQTIESITQYFKMQPLSIRLEVKERADRIKIEAMIFFKNDQFIRQEVEGDDFYQVINTLAKKLTKQVRKLKAKLNDKNKKLGYDVFTEDIEEQPEPTEIRTKFLSLKPMDVEEAMLQREVLGLDFYIFKNLDDKICVLYKRHNGYGIIECD